MIILCNLVNILPNKQQMNYGWDKKQCVNMQKYVPVKFRQWLRLSKHTRLTISWLNDTFSCNRFDFLSYRTWLILSLCLYIDDVYCIWRFVFFFLKSLQMIFVFVFRWIFFLAVFDFVFLLLLLFFSIYELDSCWARCGPQQFWWCQY